MTEHVLKTWPQYWEAVAGGAKTFEVRRDDRGFQRGDVVVLRKTTEKAPYDFQTRSGPWEVPITYFDLRFRIAWVQTGGRFGIEPGYVVLALAPEEGP